MVMRRMLKLSVIILSLVVLLAGCGGQNSLLGKPAPDFQFGGPDEQPVSLSDLQGRPVLLNFWATWCGPCRGEMPYLQQVWDEWQTRGLVLLAINIMESSSEVQSFMQSQGLSLPVLLDSDGAIAAKYGIQAIPTTFFIDSSGVVQEVKEGAFPNAAAIENSLSQLFD
jgi:cytochrome c biogenesis protein CcmG/thiol:disulfide interchange protein DsbE